MKTFLGVSLLLAFIFSPAANGTFSRTSVSERNNLLTDSRTERVVEPKVDENNIITFGDPNYFYDYSWLSQRRVRESELSSYSPLFLDLLRNAIFARHGRKFVTPELQGYFNRQPWYSARYQPNKFPASLLSSVEQHNVDTILKYQQQNGKMYFGSALASKRTNNNTVTARNVKPQPANRTVQTTANNSASLSWKGAKLIHTLSYSNNPVSSVVLSNDNKTLISGGDGIHIWNLETGQLIKTVSPLHKVQSIALSPDGKTLAAGIVTDIHNGTMAAVWDLEMGELLYQLSHAGNRVAITPDGKTLVTGLSGESKVKLMQLRTGELNQELSGKAEFSADSISVSGDGSLLAVRGRNWKLDVWNMQTSKLLRTHEFSSGYFDPVAISPNGQTIVNTKGILSSGDVQTQRSAVQIWNARTGELIRALEGHSNNLTSVAISPDSQTLATGSLDGTIRIVNLSNRELIRVLKDVGQVRSITFSSDNRTLASSSVDGKIRIWQVP